MASSFLFFTFDSMYLENYLSRLTNQVQDHLNTNSDGTCSNNNNCVWVCTTWGSRRKVRNQSQCQWGAEDVMCFQITCDSHIHPSFPRLQNEANRFLPIAKKNQNRIKRTYSRTEYIEIEKRTYSRKECIEISCAFLLTRNVLPINDKVSFFQERPKPTISLTRNKWQEKLK